MSLESRYTMKIYTKFEAPVKKINPNKSTLRSKTNLSELYSPLAYVKNELHFDGLNISTQFKNLKTPIYLYSENTLVKNFKHFKNSAINSKIKKHLICYAVKANSHRDILKTLAKLGAGADVVSKGELKKAMDSGIPPEKIVFSGVGKTKDEINFALKQSPTGIYSFNVESIEELELINLCAKKQNKVARVAFRLNPMVEAKTHKHISTGSKTHKFGILSEDILSAVACEYFWTHTQLVGLSIHIGSQLTDMRATVEAISELSTLFAKVLKLRPNLKMEFLDIGGGLGIDYTKEDQKNLTSVSRYMEIVSSSLQKSFYLNKNIPNKAKNIHILFEPGRILVGKVGVLLTKIIRHKLSEDKIFTIIDAGMNDLIRPALYEAYHEILPMKELKSNADWIKTDIVGPVCESSDCFGEDRKLPPLKAGDLLVINNAGAYGASMGSTYNEREKTREKFLAKKDN